MGDEVELKPAPEIGEFLTADMVEELYYAFKTHQKNFPQTPEILSFHTVLMFYGNKFTPVKCIEEEWTGRIQDIPKTYIGDPKCPNGHPVEKGDPMKLAWLT